MKIGRELSGMWEIFMLILKFNQYTETIEAIITWDQDTTKSVGYVLQDHVLSRKKQTP